MAISKFNRLRSGRAYQQALRLRPTSLHSSKIEGRPLNVGKLRQVTKQARRPRETIPVSSYSGMDQNK